ncbi:MAG: chromosome segregation protein SMC [Candidatus Woesearchaeota archaeon]|nr:chromosome segregation protein SMC [Candidatus Woesearchaeota archaeon]
MTKINKIVMHGFKSFAKHTELLFGDKFNCLLGPNGAGKSNILDALCFVLGKSSSKSLRAEKSSDFIYNGWKTKKASPYAEVSIYFDNSKKIFPSNEREVKISRIVKQNGQSKYKINDKTMTRQQVLDLLNIARIDPDGYNIVLQGDIVRFTEMPTEERRKVIEEIAGISVYEDKKHKAELELQKVDERLNEANVILKERETYLKELKKDRDQALKYKELNDKIRQNKATYIYTQMDRENKKKKELDEKILKHKEQVEALQRNISNLKNDILDKQGEIKKITEEVEKRGYKDSLDSEIQQLKVDTAANKTKMESFETEISRIMQRKEGLQGSLSQTEEKIESLNKEKLGLEEEKSRKLKEINDLVKKLDEFKKRNKIGKDVEDIEKEVEAIDKYLEENQNNIQRLRTEQQELLRRKDLLEFSVKSIDESIKKVEEIEKEHKKDIQDLKRKKEELKKASNELSQLLNEDSSLALQLSNSREKLTRLVEELSKLEARSVGSQERFFGNIAVKKVLENKSRLGGIYGTVGQLGKVNSKYALALEIAAGPKIDAVVVEDDKTAAKCIKYLKENKLGVATFFPLNKIKPTPIKPEVEKLKSSSGVHDLAVNLVSYESRFKDIFSHVFANTLVVDNIDVARRIGIGTSKMVTIDGDSAELSGAMHGGFRHRTKGIGFEEEDVAKNIEDKNEEAVELKTLVSSLEKRRKEVDDKVVSLRTFKANLEGDVIKIEKGLHLEDSDLDASKRKKDSLAAEIKDVDKKRDKLEDSISALNNEMAQNKTKKQELKNKINDLRNPKILAELNAFEEKKKELDADVINRGLNIKNIDDQVQSIHIRDKENTIKILKQNDKEIEGFKKQIVDLKDRIKNQYSALKEKEDKQNEFYSRFEALYKKRTKLTDEISESDKKTESLAAKLKEGGDVINGLSIDEAAIKARLAGLDEEFQQYAGVKLASHKSEEDLKKEINEFEKMRDNIGSVNMRALDIYEAVEKEFNALIEKKEKLSTEKKDVLNMMAEIEGKKKDLFMNTMVTVNDHFKKIFSLLSNKGDAFLELENEQNPFEGGVKIKVRIIGNKFLDIRSLSGGEKTLTALAFIFSIQEHQPASFYVLDEVDAALDKHNSEKFAKLIGQYSEKAQYLMISHNDHVISEADTLYGITMDENKISKVVSMKI